MGSLKLTTTCAVILAATFAAGCVLSGVAPKASQKTPTNILQAEIVEIDAARVAEHQIRAIVVINSPDHIAARLTWLDDEGDLVTGPLIEQTIMDHPSPPALYEPLAHTLLKHSGLPSDNKNKND